MNGRPQHVLLTADAVGGVWTYALDLAAGLGRQGIAVTLATLGPRPSPARRRAAEALTEVTLVETDLPLDWISDDDAALDAAARTLATLAASRGVDLIHLNSPALAWAADWPAPVVGGCHSCLASWWSAVRNDPMPDAFARRTCRLAQGYRACDLLIAPTHAFAAATAALYGVQPLAVWNGRAPPPRLAAPRERVVLTSGRLWDAGKNLATLDAAAGRMRGQVLAAGPTRGPDGAAISFSHLFPLGELSAEALARTLPHASVFCAPALYEPFGLGVLEAAQAGCALVLAHIPAFRELWDGAALFVDPRDAAGLARTLDDLLDDADRARRLGALAAARAASFTVEAMTAGTLEAYAAALGAGPATTEAAA